MKFAILVKATAGSEAGQMPTEGLMNAMMSFHQELAQAGVLVDATGFNASSTGWRIKYNGAHTTLIEGPFPETTSLVSGYTIINVASREEALAWTKRYPNPAVDGGLGEIEVRPFFELEDFGEAGERFREACASRTAEAAHA
jgi:hypothetical protein